MTVKLEGSVLIRRGVKTDLPAFAREGEPLFTVDTGELYIGKGDDTPLQKIGTSDYEVWLTQGNSGTVEDFYRVTSSRQIWQQSDW
jgi:hypothetical protein